MKKSESLFEGLDITSLMLPVAEEEEDFDKHGMEWQQAKRFAEDTGHRKGLIGWVKWVVSGWLFSVLFVVTFNSLFRFGLNDGVLIALITTTTVNILGLAYIVLKGLFNVKD